MRHPELISSLALALSWLPACGSDSPSTSPAEANPDAGGIDASPEASPNDADLPSCGDGTCNGSETCADCPSDCTVCPAPSCSTPLDCGGQSCCESIGVPGGVLMQGRAELGTDECPCDMQCLPHEAPEHQVTVSAFALDKFEVTVGRFRAFVDAYQGPPQEGAGAHPHIADSGWRAAWNDALPPSKDALLEALACDATFSTWSLDADHADRPINCVTWFEAMAFCIWDGGRLPTEAEWELVAAGGTENRLYPWGDTAASRTLASYDCTYSGDPACTRDDIAPVQTLVAGAARWGHLHMAGNLYEWVLDAYSASAYADAPPSPQDPAVLEETGWRVIRGGSFAHTTAHLRAASRASQKPLDRAASTGFRCARDL
jgi:sulfatase modifying factor 1